jgi:hypothetical protein
MPPLKLYLNEHLSPRLAEQLRQHGFDVTSTLERLLNTLSAEDLKSQIRWLNEFK